MISYGFFNSLNDDRLYNAETFNTYFEGLISSSGVYGNVGDKLIVTPGSGLEVLVGSGKAVVNNHWVKLSASETLTVTTAHNLFARYDAVTLSWNASTRNVTLQVVAGTPSSNPVKPEPTRDSMKYEIVLAYILVPANATTITSANIYDQRDNTSVCGYITGLIDQVDISTLFEQYEARFNALETSMETWQAQQKTAFDTWYYELTNNLTVGAYIEKYNKVVEGGSSVSSTIELDMDDYTYDESDIIMCNLNGLMLQPTYDYTLNSGTTPVAITIDADLTTGNRFEVTVLKSNLNQTEDGTLTSVKGDKFLYVTDALTGASHGFIVNTTGSDNTIVVTNRNLFRIDLLSSGTVSGVDYTVNDDGTVSVSGDGTSEITCNLDKNAFPVGNTYTISGSDTGASVSVTLTYSDTTTDTFTDETFTVSKEVSSAVGSISTTGEVDTTVSPQIESGSEFTEFKKNSYVTFVYDGTNKPVFTDSIDNIYSTDDDVEDMMVLFVVDASNGDNIEY